MKITEEQKDKTIEKEANEMVDKNNKIKNCKIREIIYIILTFVFALLAVIINIFTIIPTIISQLFVGFSTGFFVVSIQEYVKYKELQVKHKE